MQPLLRPEHLYVREGQKAAVLWGRAELAGGALQLSQDISVISTNLAAPSTAPLQPTAHLHAGPQQDKPHFYVFLELSSYETHLDFGRGYGLPGGLEQGNNPIKA